MDKVITFIGAVMTIGICIAGVFALAGILILIDWVTTKLSKGYKEKTRVLLNYD